MSERATNGKGERATDGKGERATDGKVALVTGASRGIGAAIGQRLAAEGARVALVARTLDQHPHLAGTLHETLRTIEAAGGTAIAIQGDLNDSASHQRIIEETRRRLGPIDILVNNAAAAFYMPFERLTEKRFRVAMDVNVYAPFALAQLVVPEMRQHGRGWILNISSATGLHPKGPPYQQFYASGGAVLYGLTKAALDRMSTGLAAELYDDGIAVNSLSPVAAVRTPGADAHQMLELPPEMIEPMEVMVEAVVALCTCDPRTLTGRVAFSGPLLAKLGRKPLTLDGKQVYEEKP